MHPRYKTKYRVGNWPAYDRALVQRGDVTLWLTPEAIATWEAVGVGKRGGQLQYSEVAIETALTLRLIFHLPLRQTEGFLRSIFGMLCLDLSAPDHTTLSRRGQHLDLALRRLPAGAGIHRCLRRSLLIGQLHPYNREGHEESHPPVHLSHEPDRWDGVRYLRV